MKKLTTDDYLSCAFFFIIACIFLGIAYMAFSNDLPIMTLVLVFLACFSLLGALWSLSDFKTWK